MENHLFKELSDHIFQGEKEATEKVTQAAIENGYQAMDLIEKGLIPGVEKVSDAFSTSEIYIPEMLLSAEAMKACLAILKPLLTSEESKGIGTVVIGTVLGDVHDIGKNLVSWLLEGAGFRVIDMGVDVSPDKYFQAIEDEDPQIIALSSLLTTSAHQIGIVVEYLEEKGIREKVKVLIGGAAVNQDFANQVGADGYALDAVGGVIKAKELLNLTE